ncbi:hypothetical protein ACIPK7_05295 [Pseudomonas sp. NPDC086581]|uniref:hypothetical protein n=1 Tax=Pseudomonas sp. NPDC086581 TaxID=3364432 RepID=UPI0037F20BF8
MNTYYLVFPLEQTADQQLSALYGNADGLVTDGQHHSLHVIGTLYEAEDPASEGDNEAPAPVRIDGWHVNLRLDGNLPESLKPFEVHPVTPSVVWL